MTPHIQKLKNGTCVLTFEEVRGLQLPSVNHAISWCAEHLKEVDGDSDHEARRTLDAVLTAPPRLYGKEVAAEVVTALLDEWARQARAGKHLAN